jgi:hypothetical protein
MGNFLRRESVCSRCLFITNTQEQTKSTTFMYMTIKLFESTHKFNAHLYEEKTVNDNTYICTRLVTSATLSSTKRCEVWSGIKILHVWDHTTFVFSEIKEAIKIVAKELLYVTMVMIVKIMSILHIRPLNRYGKRKNRFWSRVHMLPLSWGCFIYKWY